MDQKVDPTWDVSRPPQERFPWADIGEGTYGGMTAYRWDDKTKLTIGKYCSFSFNVAILCGGEHNIDWVTTFPFPTLYVEGQGIEGHPATRGDITIGSDVWVAANATILSGTTIGHGAVVAAGSIVRGDVQPYEIVGGVPAKHLSWRFPAWLIQDLLEIRWWDWPVERIAKAIPLLCQDDIVKFITAVKEGKI